MSKWYKHYVIPYWVPYIGGHQFAVNWKVVVPMLALMLLMVIILPS